MKARDLATLVTLTLLVCVLFPAVNATAEKKVIGLDGQVRSLDFSKSVPNQLNYQGFLVNATDSSTVTATLEMTFRLFDSQTKGAELWSETHSAVDVSNGLFQVLLGSVTPFLDGFFDGSDMWLQTEVGVEVLTPRKPLVSTAYSHQAEDADHAAQADDADQLEGQTLTDLDDRWVNEDQANSVTSAMITNGEIVDADVSVTADIHPGKIAGTAWTADNDGAGSGLDADMVDGLDAADFISMDDLDHLDAHDGDPANAVYVDDAGKVGVGTSSPLTELDVSGSVNATTYYGDGSHLTGISGTADGDWTISGNNMHSAVPGSVGIGTTSPAAKLDVQGTLNVGADSIGYDVNFYGTDSGVRLLWDESRKALRAGRDSDGTYWAPGNVGLYSLGIGADTKASGWYSTATGGYTTASGDYSVAMGFGPTASGEYGAIAMGNHTTASGNYSTALGYNTTASGIASTALGYLTTASAEGATGIGWQTTAGSHATAIGEYVTAEGGNIVLGRGVSNAERLVNDISNSLMVGFNDTTATLFVGGSLDRVGIGTSNPAYKLQVGEAGDGTQARANAWNLLSSQDYKENIRPFESADYQEMLEKLIDTKVVRYRFSRDENRIEHLGVIAEDSPREIQSPDGKGLSLGDYSAFLLAAIKAQQERIEALEEKIQMLQLQFQDRR